MIEPLQQLLRLRTTVEHFDRQREVSPRTIRELISDATRAPSSFNIQHWRFVAVTSQAGKRRLREAAYGQRQVEEASVVLIVLGDTRGVERLSDVMELAVARGALPRGKAVAWIHMAREIYRDAELARDEAIRSASLASMVLMLSAQARGLASGALIGFDPQRVRSEFEIGEQLVPVMLLTLGYPSDEPGTPKPRLAVDDVLAFESAAGFPPPEE